MASDQNQPTADNVADVISLLRTNDPHSQEAAYAVRALAAATKSDVAVRHRLANPLLLAALVRVIEASLGVSSLATADHALRCIGNACADNDEAREEITELKFSWATRCLGMGDGHKEEDLKFLTIQVLYNICLDYEPAQQQCYREGIHFGVLRFFYEASSGHVVYSMDNLVDLAFLITGHKATLEPQLAKPMDDTLLENMLGQKTVGVWHMRELDTHVALMEIMQTYLRDPSVQEQIVSHRIMLSLWMYTEYWANIAEAAGGEPEDHAEKLKILLPLGTSLTWIASDIAARPDFAAVYSLEDELFVPLIHKLTAGMSGSHDGLDLDQRSNSTDVDALQATIACQILGNFLWSSQPAASAVLVERHRLHESLYTWILTCNTDLTTSAGLMHSVAGLLLQLSRPSVQIRELMASDSNALPAIEKLCRHAMAEMKQDGLKLIRGLGKNSAINQTRFMALASEAMQLLSNASNEASNEVPPENVS